MKSCIIVKFSDDCGDKICKDFFGLKNLVNCKKPKQDGFVVCNYSALENFAIVVEKGIVEILPNDVCPHGEVCRLGDNCLGKNAKRGIKKSFLCNLGSLTGPQKTKDKKPKGDRSQLLLFT